MWTWTTSLHLRTPPAGISGDIGKGFPPSLAWRWDCDRFAQCTQKQDGLSRLQAEALLSSFAADVQRNWRSERPLVLPAVAFRTRRRTPSRSLLTVIEVDAMSAPSPREEGDQALLKGV